MKMLYFAMVHSHLVYCINIYGCARDNLRGQKSLGPLKMSLEMAHNVIVPQKKLCPAVSLTAGH
jgi:hypothetical protein